MGISIVYSNETASFESEIFLRESPLLNMESKGIQKRKAGRDRAALIYMSAIIFAL